MPNKMKIPQMMNRGEFKLDSVDLEKRTVEFCFSTGSKGLQRIWDDNEYRYINFYEELDLNPGSVRLERFNSGAAFLKDHYRSVDFQHGSVEKAWLQDGKGYCLVRFATDEASDVLFKKISEGIVRNVSVGYKVYRYKDVTEDPTAEIKTYRAIDWEPLELSAIAVNFDKDAQSRSEKDLNECIIERSEIENNRIMEEPEMPTPAIKTPVAEPVIQTNGAEIERARVLDIQTLCRTHSMDEEFSTRAIKEGIEIAQVRENILIELARQDEAKKVRNVTPVQVGEDLTRAALMTSMESAIIHRADPKAKLELDAGKYMHMPLADMARVFVKDGQFMAKDEVVKRAMSVSDFPQILANVANKTLRSAYDYNAKTHKSFAREVEVSDFKTIKRTQLSSGSKLEKILENGEFKHGKMSEGSEGYKVESYGKIISITRQTIINDDLDAMTRIPQLFGNGAADLEADLVYGLLNANGVMSDNKALFHADHKNLGAALALGSASLSKFRELLRSQKDLDGKFINILLKYLVVSPALETTAEQLISSLIAPTKSEDLNVFRGKLELIVDPRLVGTAYYGIADYNQVDTIELAYLTGAKAPKTETRMGWEVDGVQIKVSHDVGAGVIDWRGLVKNPGV